jgi:hypothetical protein
MQTSSSNIPFTYHRSIFKVGCEQSSGKEQVLIQLRHYFSLSCILYLYFSNTVIWTIAEPRLCRDVQHILVCIRKLPAQNFSAETVRNYGLLDEFLAEKFGTKVDEWLTCTLGTDSCLQMFSGGKYGKWEVAPRYHNCWHKILCRYTLVSFPCDLLPCCHRKLYIFKFNWKVNPGLLLMAFLSI